MVANKALCCVIGIVCVALPCVRARLVRHCAVFGCRPARRPPKVSKRPTPNACAPGPTQRTTTLLSSLRVTIQACMCDVMRLFVGVTLSHVCLLLYASALFCAVVE